MSITGPDGEWTTRLLDMESALEKDVPDRPGVLYRIAAEIRKSFAGLRDSKRPIASFLLVGSLDLVERLAGGLAEFLFGDLCAVLSLDMGDYSEKHQVLRLFGHNGGWICSFVEGQLTEPIRRHPRTVILLRDIEKAHIDVIKALVYILEEGHLKDTCGRRVPFSETILLLTTKVGQENTDAPFVFVIHENGWRSCGDLSLEGRSELTGRFAPDLLRLVNAILPLW